MEIYPNIEFMRAFIYIYIYINSYISEYCLFMNVDGYYKRLGMATIYFGSRSLVLMHPCGKVILCVWEGGKLFLRGPTVLLYKKSASGSIIFKI